MSGARGGRGRARVPLERALSKLGLASRTQARQWILAGEVSVNGRACCDPFFPVIPEQDRFTRNGKPLAPPSRRTLLFYKPNGVTVTRSDEKGRATVFDLHPGAFAGLHAVGRLDMATSGLLILTNDTRLSAALTDPTNRIERVYLVTVKGEVTGETAALAEKGVPDKGETLRAERVEIRKSSGRESHLTVTLTEGKNREIRRLFGALSHEVIRIKRVAFGRLALGGLQPGEWRELAASEIAPAFPGLPVSRARV